MRSAASRRGRSVPLRPTRLAAKERSPPRAFTAKSVHRQEPGRQFPDLRTGLACEEHSPVARAKRPRCEPAHRRRHLLSRFGDRRPRRLGQSLVQSRSRGRVRWQRPKLHDAAASASHEQLCVFGDGRFNGFPQADLTFRPCVCTVKMRQAASLRLGGWSPRSPRSPCGCLGERSGGWRSGGWGVAAVCPFRQDRAVLCRSRRASPSGRRGRAVVGRGSDRCRRSDGGVSTAPRTGSRGIMD